MATDIKNSIIDKAIDEATSMEYVHFKLKGQTPLLMHNPKGSMTVTSNAPKRGKEIPTPEEEAERGTYRTEEGLLCVPSSAVRNCLLNGSKGLKVGSRAASPYISGAVLPTGEYFTLVNEDGSPIENYAIDTRRVVIQKAGIMRSRAKIELDWYIEGKFVYRPTATIEVIYEAFKDAGQTMGLLDYRIEKKGPFGSFTVEELEII